MAAPISKSTLMAQCQAIIAALQTLPVTEYVLGGKAYSKADLVSVFQAYVDAANASATAKKSLQNSNATEKTAATTFRSTRSLLHVFLQSHFGKSSPELTPFGFSPAKTVKKTVEVKAVAVEKALATREARHTLGKKQKAAIKGVVPTPATAAAHAPAPAQATETPVPPVVPTATASPGATVGAAPAVHPATGS